MENQDKLHVVMLPWLAMGHLIPFLELSKCLARKGHRVSFVSTPRNIGRLPKIPSTLSSLINLVKLPFPRVDDLPEYAEATIDLPVKKVHYLKKAFDGLEGPFASFLEDSAPVSWIIYDFAAYWLPPLVAKLGLPCAFFCLVNAAAVSVIGPPSILMEDTSQDSRKTLEEFLASPKWIPFPSKIVYRVSELLRMLEASKDGNVAAVSETYRFGTSVQASNVMFIRSCTEFEPEWISLLQEEIYKKPIIPVGLLPPPTQETRGDDETERWIEMSEWLAKHKQGSVVYVAIGTEAELSQEEVTELALGLELSELPFFWVLRMSLHSSAVLPDGFEARIGERGFICTGWAPQVRVLAHPSVGGFLTHCGWNSVIEALGFGHVLILLPFLADQGLNARVLVEKNVGVEIERGELDGSFTRESVAKSLRMVMVNTEGEPFRTNARQMKTIFGNNDLHDGYIDKLVQYLQDYRCKIGDMDRVVM